MADVEARARETLAAFADHNTWPPLWDPDSAVQRPGDVGWSVEQANKAADQVRVAAGVVVGMAALALFAGTFVVSLVFVFFLGQALPEVLASDGIKYIVGAKAVMTLSSLASAAVLLSAAAKLMLPVEAVIRMEEAKRVRADAKSVDGLLESLKKIGDIVKSQR